MDNQPSSPIQSGQAQQPISHPASRPLLIGPGQLLAQSWKIFKLHWKIFVGIQAIVGAVALIGIGLFVGPLLFFTTQKPMQFNFNIYWILLFILYGLLLLLSIVALYSWGQIALIMAAKEGGEISIKDALKRSRGLIRPYFNLIFLAGLVIIGGYVLFFIPGIIFAMWFSLATYVLVGEDRKGMQALLASREYVRNYFFQVLGRLIVIGLVSAILQILLAVLLGFLENMDIIPYMTVMSQIINQGINFFVIAPLGAIYGYSLYLGLRQVKGTVTPSQAARKWYIIVAILGILLPIIITVAIFYFVFFAISNTDKILQKGFQDSLDHNRGKVMTQMQEYLDDYYMQNKSYPNTFDPNDFVYSSVASSNPRYENYNERNYFHYRIVDDGQEYELCVAYESKPRECVRKSGSVILTPTYAPVSPVFPSRATF